MWNFEEARSYIAQVSRLGSVLGLENMYALMKQLGNPQNEIPVIHIAGTNGKGSVGAYLASILKEAGLIVGRYCSPAVFDPLEVWQYDGRNITKEEYAAALSQVKAACDILALQEDRHPTVFEVETAMAFVYFKQMQVDILLLETGLGGASDATNVVESPIANVFTTISRDHMQFLGETLGEIASVKAGIIKQGAAVFSAPQVSEVALVLDQAQKQWNPQEKIIYVQEAELKLLSQIPGNLSFVYKEKSYTTRLSGLYQLKNAALAIEVANWLFKKTTRNVTIFSPIVWCMIEEKQQGNKTVSDRIEVGIRNTSWPGRFEVISEDPILVIDGAHNEDAVKQLAITVQNSFTNQPVDFIIGILADKEHERMLELMMPFAGRVYTITPPNLRGLDGKVLAEEVRQWHNDVISCASIEEALLQAMAHSKVCGCPIVAFGSLSYLGQLRECYNQIGESRMRDV